MGFLIHSSRSRKSGIHLFCLIPHVLSSLTILRCKWVNSLLCMLLNLLCFCEVWCRVCVVEGGIGSRTREQCLLLICCFTEAPAPFGAPCWVVLNVVHPKSACVILIIGSFAVFVTLRRVSAYHPSHICMFCRLVRAVC